VRCAERGGVDAMRKAIGYLVVLVMLVVAMSSFHLTGGKDAPETERLLVRVSQLDPGQYRSTAEYTTWAYSTCSRCAS